MFKKSVFVVAVFLAIFASFAWAGDSASFVDLGFSPDGKYFMFAQYGVQSGLLRPWAELFVVDVARNNFVSGGKASYTHDSPVLAGQDGSGALYRIIAKNTALADQYRLNYLNQGQPLYVVLNADAVDKNISFRDFETETNYQANIVSYAEGSGQELKSSFYITLEATARNGTRKTYTVGNPQIKRPLIESYNIKKVMIAPKDGSLIFVIEMRRLAQGGPDIRYMVEALRL